MPEVWSGQADDARVKAMRDSLLRRRTVRESKDSESIAVSNCPWHDLPSSRATSVSASSPAPVRQDSPRTAKKGISFFSRCCPGNSQRRKTKAALFPPKPKELDKTVFTSASMAFEVGWIFNAGSGVSNPNVGGIFPDNRVPTEITASKAPAAARGCPNAPLTEATGGTSSPNSCLMARASAISLSGVAVPCRLM
ncbi:MAG: hypothetical protein A4E66_00875 [Syntrophus sp. PtaB.Bin001]|nr:MAG: hypothetical protein A4E66_00875 [Syntrophus sp. PtaB.Bin001]